MKTTYFDDKIKNILNWFKDNINNRFLRNYYGVCETLDSVSVKVAKVEGLLDSLKNGTHLFIKFQNASGETVTSLEVKYTRLINNVATDVSTGVKAIKLASSGDNPGGNIWQAGAIIEFVYYKNKSDRNDTGSWLILNINKVFNDGEGNNISDTYETKENAIVDITASGTTLTLVKGDGDTSTAINTQDENLKQIRDNTSNLELPLLLKNSINDANISEVISTSKFTSNVTINPSTGIITANEINAEIDAVKITSGTIDIARLPAAALERIHVVTTQAAMLALTTATVQNGDIVKIYDSTHPENSEMYVVKDDTHLDNLTLGYEKYYVGNAVEAARLGNIDKGNNKQFIYLDDGSPVATTASEGNSTTPVYLKNGVITSTGVDLSTLSIDSNVVHKTDDEIIAGNKTFSGELYLTKTKDIASNTDTKGALTIGSDIASHLKFDGNEIISMSAATTAGPLYLNLGGGKQVYIDTSNAKGKVVTGASIGNGKQLLYTDSDGEIELSNENVGNSTTPVYLNNGVITSTGIDLSTKANLADLATVSTSGSYNDLNNKPTIPSIPDITIDSTISGSGNAITAITIDSTDKHKLKLTQGKTFVEEGDSRLTDTRDPNSHAHGELTNAGLLATASRVAITDSNKKLTISSITTTKLGYLTDVTSNIQAQLNSKAPLASPVFTGVPTAPNPSVSSDDTSIATTEWVNDAIEAGTANKVSHKFTLNIDTGGITTFSGNNKYEFDGSSDKTLELEEGSNIIFTTSSGKLNIASEHPSISQDSDTTSTSQPSYGQTFTTIDSITKDINGHVTKINTKTVTIPVSDNVDTKVTNTLSTTTKAYITGTTSSDTNTGTQIFDTGVYLDNTAGKLTVEGELELRNSSLVMGKTYTNASTYRSENVLEVKNTDSSAGLNLRLSAKSGLYLGAGEDIVTTFNALTPSDNVERIFLIADAGIVFKNTGSKYVYNQHYSLVKGTNPASTTYTAFCFQDSTGIDGAQRLGVLGSKVGTTGNVITYLTAYKFEANSTTNTGLELVYPASGYPYATAPSLKNSSGDLELTAANSNNNYIATTEWVNAKISELVGGAGAAYDTLKELQDAITNSNNAITTDLLTQIGEKAPTAHATSAPTYGISASGIYGHAKPYTSSPSINGVASPGDTYAEFAMGNHVHPLQTSVSGNAGTSDAVDQKISTSNNTYPILIGKTANATADIGKYPVYFGAKALLNPSSGAIHTFGSIVKKYENFDKGDLLANTGGFYWFDQSGLGNSDRLGALIHHVTATGDIDIGLYAYKNSVGDTTYKSLILYNNLDGTSWITAPTPTYLDTTDENNPVVSYDYAAGNVDKVVTARWVRNATGNTALNSATATKLVTARTLWGQSFDGTANITGSLSDVENITLSGNININRSDITRGTTTTKVEALITDVRDSAGNRVSASSTIYNANKSSITGIYAYNTTIATGNSIGSIAIGCDTSGNAYTKTITPDYSDTGTTKIATTEWVRNATGNTTLKSSGWSTARSFTIQDSSGTYSGTATAVDGSEDEILNMPLKATIRNSFRTTAGIPDSAAARSRIAELLDASNNNSDLAGITFENNTDANMIRFWTYKKGASSYGYTDIYYDTTLNKQVLEHPGTLLLTNSTDAKAASDNGVALIIGPKDRTSTAHMILDRNEIETKATATTGGTLYINGEGHGEVYLEGSNATYRAAKGASIGSFSIPVYSDVNGFLQPVTSIDPSLYINTDTKVTQDVSTSNDLYPILLCPTADASVSQGEKTSIFASSVKVQPSQGIIWSKNIELTGSATTNGGFIDFHYNNSSSDYTSRIIESTSGTLNLNNVTINNANITAVTNITHNKAGVVNFVVPDTNINLSTTYTSSKEYWPINIKKSAQDTVHTDNIFQFGAVQYSNAKNFYAVLRVANPRGGNLPTSTEGGAATSNCWGGIGVYYDYTLNKAYPYTTTAQWPLSSSETTGLVTSYWVRNATGNTTLNAASADKLKVAKSLTTKLDSTTAVTFDGSADQDEIPVSGILPLANGGTGNSIGAAVSLVISSKVVDVNFDFNSYTTAGNYHLKFTEGTTLNCPPIDTGLTRDCLLEVKVVEGMTGVSANSRIIQMAYVYNPDTATYIDIFYRKGFSNATSGSVWTSWTELVEVGSAQTISGNKTIDISGKMLITGVSTPHSYGITNGTYSTYFLIGSGGTNRGLWDATLNNWMIYADASSVYLKGNADTATCLKRTYISLVEDFNSIGDAGLYQCRYNEITLNSPDPVAFSSSGYRDCLLEVIRLSSATSVTSNGRVIQIYTKAVSLSSTTPIFIRRGIVTASSPFTATWYSWDRIAASDYVALTGDQSIAGTKTFSSAIIGNLTGNADTATYADLSKSTLGIYLVIPNETSSTATLTATVNGITEYFVGLTIALRMPFANAASTTLNINNLGAKPVYYGNNTASSGRAVANTTILLVYETITVSTGSFKMIYSYNANNAVNQNVRNNTVSGTYPVLMAATANATANISATATYFSPSIKMSPSEGLIYSNSPAISANDTSLVTTEWVRSATGTFTGAKTFTQGPYGTTSVVSGTEINLANGNVFTKTLTSSTTFTFTGVPTGVAATFSLILICNGFPVFWPSSVRWTADTAPLLSSSGKKDVLTFLTPDGGNTWYGSLSVGGVTP